MTFPISKPPKEYIEDYQDIDCKQTAEQVFQNLLQKNLNTEMAKLKKHMIYPQNYLRNIAKHSCQTSHTLVLDVDMIPNPGLYEDLEVFLSDSNVSQCEKCAFVVPTFEIDVSYQFKKIIFGSPYNG